MGERCEKCDSVLPNRESYEEILFAGVSEEQRDRDAGKMRNRVPPAGLNWQIVPARVCGTCGYANIPDDLLDEIESQFGPRSRMRSDLVEQASLVDLIQYFPSGRVHLREEGAPLCRRPDGGTPNTRSGRLREVNCDECNRRLREAGAPPSADADTMMQNRTE